MSEPETSEQSATLYPPKSEWGPGPWQDEPDRLEWRHQGVPCLLRRSPILGTWCGYAAAEPGHPWHGQAEPDEAEVHGGLTFASRCDGEICHVPQAGEPDDVWWLGFDCGHAFDLQPAMRACWRKVPGLELSGMEMDVTYRDIAYARAETERLAEQLIAARTP